jgi:hypothetical protein
LQYNTERNSYNPPNTIDDVNFNTKKVLPCDPGFGSSAFGIVVAEQANRQIQILEAEEYHRPDFDQMIGVVWDLLMKYGRSINKIYVDGDNPSFIRALKLQMGEDEEYDQVIKGCKASHRDFEYDMTVVPVNFSMENRSMLSNCKMLMERDGGFCSH